MANGLVMAPENGKLFMTVSTFKRWVAHQLEGCKDKYIEVRITDFPDLHKPVARSVPLSFSAVVLDGSSLSGKTLKRLTSKQRRGYALSKGNAHLRDEINAKRHMGKFFTKKQILRIFGYSPQTYIHDTNVMHRGLVVEVGPNRFKVVGVPCKKPSV